MSPPISDTAFWSRRLTRDFGPVRLVRIGENALWHASELGIAIRLYRHETSSMDKAVREIAAAQTLAKRGVPVIRLARETPVAITNRTATLWDWCVTTGAPVDPCAFGSLLRAAHAAWRRGVDAGASFPIFDPISKVAARLERIAVLEEAPLLQQRLDQAAQLWAAFRSCVPPQIIHGDAHSGNVIATPDGLVLADFDETKKGPVEWDLVSMVVGHLRFGRPRTDLDAFAKGMGADPRMLQGARELAPVKELSALTWLGTRALEDADAHAELRRRIGLSDEGMRAVWRPL